MLDERGLPKRFSETVLGESPLKSMFGNNCLPLGLEDDVRFQGCIEHAQFLHCLKHLKGEGLRVAPYP